MTTGHRLFLKGFLCFNTALSSYALTCALLKGWLHCGQKCAWKTEVGDWKLSCDVMMYGSVPIRWLFFDMRSFKYNHLMLTTITSHDRSNFPRRCYIHSSSSYVTSWLRNCASLSALILCLADTQRWNELVGVKCCKTVLGAAFECS